MNGQETKNIMASIIAVGTIMAGGDSINDVYANDAWITRSFNSTKEDYLLAGHP
jgi:hypothetical protein